MKPRLKSRSATKSPGLWIAIQHGVLATSCDTTKSWIVMVEREKAQFSTWYEVFPRSCASEPGRHGTFKDCEAWLPDIASMGFDVLYLPPIHPIGRTFRKGKNNSVVAQPDDVGSPWAIGAEEGGHTSVHPQLGTLDDFRRLVAKAQEYGIEVALDIAFQCSPDHPYTRDHAEWFRKRPDGTIQYAENPPKKYQDIYPFDFETSQWRELWAELRRVFAFWIQQGVRIFRVDNPHTKALPFLAMGDRESEGRIPGRSVPCGSLHAAPVVMYRLAARILPVLYVFHVAKHQAAGIDRLFHRIDRKRRARLFSAESLAQHTRHSARVSGQAGGHPAFMIRLILAATLGSNYGVYGPAFELSMRGIAAAAVPWERRPYLNFPEKYELKHRDLNSPLSLKSLIARINQIRRDNPALQSNHNLRFHETDNPLRDLLQQVHGAILRNTIVVVVNLDPLHTQPAWINLDLESLGLDANRAFQAHDLLSGTRATYGKASAIMWNWYRIACLPTLCACEEGFAASEISTIISRGRDPWSIHYINRF